MKFNEKLRATQLRKQGLSLNEIQKAVLVSKSSLSRWLLDVPMSLSQKRKLLDRKTFGRLKGARVRHEKRIAQTKQIVAEGKKEFPNFVKTPLFLAGLLLYWAEGDKHKQEAVKFTNSDPAMIKLMMLWFREIARVPEDKFRIALHIHNLHVMKNIKGYWSRVTGIPFSQFSKIYVKKSSLGLRKNILYNGTCAILVHNRSLFRKILGWKSGLLDFFKIMAP